MMSDDMGNPKNLTLKTLAEAAVAGNDGSAQDLLSKTKEALNNLSTEDLQKEIDLQTS